MGELKKMAVALKEWWEKKASESALRMVPKPGRRRRNHQADSESIEHDRQYKLAWEQSHSLGVSKADFAKDRGDSVVQCNRKLNRQRKREEAARGK